MISINALVDKQIGDAAQRKRLISRYRRSTWMENDTGKLLYYKRGIALTDKKLAGMTFVKSDHPMPLFFFIIDKNGKTTEESFSTPKRGIARISYKVPPEEIRVVKFFPHDGSWELMPRDPELIIRFELISIICNRRASFESRYRYMWLLDSGSLAYTPLVRDASNIVCVSHRDVENIEAWSNAGYPPHPVSLCGDDATAILSLYFDVNTVPLPVELVEKINQFLDEKSK